ncbi:Stage II sporulation protein P (SpoIIP) [compost metagenome]
MLFNGLSRNSKGEDIASLYNPNLQANLAFSLQLQLKGRELFPGLMYKNYLKGYRFNLHLREKSILAEVGTAKNTVQEEKNSMKYLAEVLDQVLQGEE